MQNILVKWPIVNGLHNKLLFKKMIVKLNVFYASKLF